MRKMSKLREISRLAGDRHKFDDILIDTLHVTRVSIVYIKTK